MVFYTFKLDILLALAVRSEVKYNYVLFATWFCFLFQTWERKHGWHVHVGREPVYPGEPGYPKLSNRTFADYCDREFKNSPI